MVKRVKRIIKFKSSRTQLVTDITLSALQEKIKKKRGELNRLLGLLKRYPESQTIKDHIAALQRELEELEKEYLQMLKEKLKEE